MPSFFNEAASAVVFQELYRGYMGLYGDDGKENENNYSGFRV